MLRIGEGSISTDFNVEYKKKYARHFQIGRLKDISNSEAYLLTKNNKASLNLKDEISILFKLGERKRVIQASVISSDAHGVKLKFHFYNNKEYQIVDDLIYFIEKSKEERRQSLDLIFNQAL